MASDLKLESGKSVKLESNGQVGFFFRVTLKDEKKSRTMLERNYETISTKSSGVSFRNDALKEINETFLKARREYEQQQQSVVKEILGVAGLYFFFTNKQIIKLLFQICFCFFFTSWIHRGTAVLER